MGWPWHHCYATYRSDFAQGRLGTIYMPPIGVTVVRVAIFHLYTTCTSERGKCCHGTIYKPPIKVTMERFGMAQSTCHL